MLLVASHLHRTMFTETRFAIGSGAEKFAGLAMQTGIGRVRTHRIIPPSPRKSRLEAGLPFLAAVPEAIDPICFAERRDEQHTHLRLLERVRVSDAALEGEFPTLPLGNPRG